MSVSVSITATPVVETFDEDRLFNDVTLRGKVFVRYNSQNPKVRYVVLGRTRSSNGPRNVVLYVYDDVVEEKAITVDQKFVLAHDTVTITVKNP